MHKEKPISYLQILVLCATGLSVILSIDNRIRHDSIKLKVEGIAGMLIKINFFQFLSSDNFLKS